MPSISACRNPFDFANPVQGDERDLLAGREEQLNQIDYYLAQLSSNRQAINFALLGERAAGKTSLLNAAANIAEEKGHVVARIDLTEADVESPTAFWYKLFDEALHAVILQGHLDGEFGPFYSCYLNAVSGNSKAEDEQYRIFRSPEVFAQRQQGQPGWAPVHEGLIKRDLRRLVEEVPVGLVLLFDECDVLGANPSLLQQFRNVFMPLRGCLVGLAATPQLFPDLSNTYSPIIRQFKSIEVGPFVESSQVSSCVEERLRLLAEDLDVSDSDNWLSQVTGWGSANSDKRQFVQEVLDVTGGHPHQVQLICHLAFRRFQLGESDHMWISLEVVNEMIEEIGLTEDAGSRSVPRALIELSERERGELDLLARCSGKATVEQLAVAAAIADPAGSWSAAAAQKRVDRLRDAGVLTVSSDGTVTFAGDSLDRAYCRLFARLRRERLVISSLTFDLHLMRVISGRLGREIRPYYPSLNRAKLLPGARLLELRSLIECALDGGWASVSPDAAQRRELSRLAAPNIYDEAIVAPDVLIVFVEAATQWSELSFVTVNSRRTRGPSGDVANVVQGDFASALDGICSEIEVATGEAATITYLVVPPIPESIWGGWIRESGSLEERERLALNQQSQAIDLYFEDEPEKALTLLDDSLGMLRNAFGLNNAGYVALSAGQIDVAMVYLAEAVEKDVRNVLARYNYALALAIGGETLLAREQAELAVTFDELEPLTMLLPVGTDGIVSSREVQLDPPGPVAASIELLEVLDSVAGAASVT